MNSNDTIKGLIEAAESVLAPNGKKTKDLADLHTVQKRAPQFESTDEANAFVGAAAKAKAEGKKQFVFSGKTYPVEIAKEVANTILKAKKEDTDDDAEDAIDANLKDLDKSLPAEIKKKVNEGSLEEESYNQGLLVKLLAKNLGLDESTAEYAKSLEKIANDRKMKSISKKDRDTLSKIADLLKRANESKKLDPVNKKAVGKDFDDRKDKDIDNDGDVDSSDEYLHKRRKAISKAIKKEASEKDFKPHMMYDPKTGKGYKADTYTDHLKYDEMGYVHDKPEDKKKVKKEYVGPALTPANQIAKKFGGKVKAINVKDDKGKKTKMFYAEENLEEAVNFRDVEKVMKWAKKNIKAKKFEIDKKNKIAFIDMGPNNVFMLHTMRRGELYVVHDTRGYSGKSGTAKEYEFTKDNAAEEVIKLISKILGIKEDTLEEAVDPRRFVLGGKTKTTKADVDKIIGKLFLDDNLLKKLEKSKAFQAGEKSKGKKKNPYKDDTADYHHFELGIQSSQVS
jgi:hypothetical protein